MVKLADILVSLCLRKQTSMTLQPIAITSEWIKLDAFLKLAVIVMSGGEAKIVITEGNVSVNGQEERRRGRKLFPGDTVTCCGHSYILEADAVNQ